MDRHNSQNARQGNVPRHRPRRFRGSALVTLVFVGWAAWLLYSRGDATDPIAIPDASAPLRKPAIPSLVSDPLESRFGSPALDGTSEPRLHPVHEAVHLEAIETGPALGEATTDATDHASEPPTPLPPATPAPALRPWGDLSAPLSTNAAPEVPAIDEQTSHTDDTRVSANDPAIPSPALRSASSFEPQASSLFTYQIDRTLRPIREVDTRTKPQAGDYHPDDPDDMAATDQPLPPRAAEVFDGKPVEFHGSAGVRYRPWPERFAIWEASALCHKPLYFEEITAERYGYSFGLAQPVVSAAHFFGRIPALPYLMTLDPPYACQYTLGHERPGSPVPPYIHTVPFDPAAAAVQGGVVTGMIYLVP